MGQSALKPDGNGAHWIVAALSLALLGATGAYAQDSRAEQAALQAQLQKNPGDIEKTYAYVHVSTALGDYEAAIGALERLLMFDPGLSEARAELSTLYLRLGSPQTAAIYLKGALSDPALDPVARAESEAFLSDAGKESGPSRVFGRLQTGLRYQSNPDFIPDGGLYSVAFGAPVIVPSGQKSRGDWNAFQLAQVGHDLDLSATTRLETRAAGYVTEQFRQSGSNVALFNMSVGPRFFLNGSIPGASIKPYATVATATLGGSPYYDSIGAGIAARVPFGVLVSIEPSLEWRRMSVHDTRLLPIVSGLGSGDVTTGTVAGIVKLNDFMTLETRGRVSHTSAELAFQSNNQVGADAMLRVEIDPPADWIVRKWTIGPYARLSSTSYASPNPAVNPNVSRRDWMWTTGLSLEAPLTVNFGLAGFVEYARNESNIVNYRTKNFSVLFGPTARF